ncbi:ribosomal protein L14 [Serendipita vermifera]|nr:ribosomal protein L14 [Serendipita vermifera]
MIGLKGRVNIIDNTGALIAECVNVLKNKTSHGHASVGDTFVCVIQKARPIPQNAAGAPSSGSTLTSLKMKRGDVQRAVLVRSKKAVMRPDGRWVRFDDNAAVLVNKKNEMIGTRIGGVVSSDLRRKGWGKIVALAPKLISVPGSLDLYFLLSVASILSLLPGLNNPQ